LVELGLFLDWTTTIWAVLLVGINAESNANVRPFLQGSMLPWHFLHLIGMVLFPSVIISLHRRGVWEGLALSLILVAVGLLGVFLVATGINNIQQIYIWLSHH
jgi:hypothetical protein